MFWNKKKDISEPAVELLEKLRYPKLWKVETHWSNTYNYGRTKVCKLTYTSNTTIKLDINIGDKCNSLAELTWPTEDETKAIFEACELLVIASEQLKIKQDREDFAKRLGL